jgi:hypothetical protein
MELVRRISCPLADFTLTSAASMLHSDETMNMSYTLDLTHAHGGHHLHTLCRDVLTGPLELLKGEALRRLTVQGGCDRSMNGARLVHPALGEVWSVIR